MKSKNFSKKGLAKLALLGLATGLMISNPAVAASIQFDDNNELNQQMARGGCPNKCPNKNGMHGHGINKASCNGKGSCNGHDKGMDKASCNGKSSCNGHDKGVDKASCSGKSSCNGHDKGETSMNERTRRYNPHNTNNNGQISMKKNNKNNDNDNGNGKDKGSCGGSKGCGGISL